MRLAGAPSAKRKPISREPLRDREREHAVDAERRSTVASTANAEDILATKRSVPMFLAELLLHRGETR